MMSSAHTSASPSTSKSRFITGLDSHTPTQLGENAHMEYGWSNAIRERIVQLSFQLVRTDNPKQLGGKMAQILDEVWTDSDPANSGRSRHSDSSVIVNTMMRMLASTRDVEDGKGEWTLGYELLRSWWGRGDERARHDVCHMIYYFVHDLPEDVVGKSTHPLGSWKDIKAIWAYFGGVNAPEQLTKFLVNLINDQVRKDACFLTKSGPGGPSLCCRWIPREGAAKKSAHPFKPFNHLLAYDYFSNYISTAKTVASRTAARKKAIADYRRLTNSLSELTKTPQQRMCARDYSGIDYTNVTSVTMRKNTRAFQYLDKKGNVRGTSEDRIAAAKQFADFVAKAKSGEGPAIKGKRVGLNTMVSDGLNLAYGYGNSIDIDVINLQWKDAAKKVGNLGNFVAMIDTSGSMDGDPLHAAIGLGLHVAEKSKLGRRVMTFSANPDWINLDGATEFTDMLKLVRHTKWGMNTNFTRALDMILNTIETLRLAPEEVSDMVLAIFSDMQIDANNNESLSESMWRLIERKYHDCGMRVHGRPYSVPHILFWNLRHTSGFPVTSTQKNVTMFSGFSPALLNAFCDKGMEFLNDVSPWNMLMRQLDNPRFDVSKFPDIATTLMAGLPSDFWASTAADNGTEPVADAWG